MCGRYMLQASPEAIADHFGLPEVPDLLPRSNLAGRRRSALRGAGGVRVPAEARRPSIGRGASDITGLR